MRAFNIVVGISFVNLVRKAVAHPSFVVNISNMFTVRRKNWAFLLVRHAYTYTIITLRANRNNKYLGRVIGQRE